MSVNSSSKGAYTWPMVISVDTEAVGVWDSSEDVVWMVMFLVNSVGCEHTLSKLSVTEHSGSLLVDLESVKSPPNLKIYIIQSSAVATNNSCDTTHRETCGWS